MYIISVMTDKVILGISSSTTFYIITLYFGSIGIKKIRYSLFAGLCADLIGVIISIVVVSLMFGNI